MCPDIYNDYGILLVSDIIAYIPVLIFHAITINNSLFKLDYNFLYIDLKQREFNIPSLL